VVEAAAEVEVVLAAVMAAPVWAVASDWAPAGLASAPVADRASAPADSAWVRDPVLVQAPDQALAPVADSATAQEPASALAPASDSPAPTAWGQELRTAKPTGPPADSHSRTGSRRRSAKVVGARCGNPEQNTGRTAGC
jgi:hypothetical protein